MSLIQQALESADETRAIEFGHGALARTGGLFRSVFPDATALVVADENTFAAAGAEVLASLSAAGVVLAAEPFILPGTPTLYADYDNTGLGRERLRQRQPDADRCAGLQSRPTGHHGGLSGAVGVPHLAALDREPFGEFGRAGLTAEDQQPDRLECFGRP